VTTEKDLLQYIGKQPRHMAGFKQIVHDFGLKGRQRRDLEELLHNLTRQRKLVAIGKERWSLPTSTSSQDLVVGTLRMHRDGYGFVTPDPGALPPRARGTDGKPKLAGDIFIPPPAIGSAMHGDQVLVELGPIRQDGRAEGRILRVSERQHETVVGKFHYGARHNYVTPIDEKLTMEVIIPPGMEIPGASPTSSKSLSASTTSTQSTASTSQAAPSPKHSRRTSPHRVLGEEAQRRASTDDLEGKVVEVEIIQWPSAMQQPRGRVVEVLGREDDFGVDVEIIIRKHHIRHVFPPAVLEEAQQINPVIPKEEAQRRRDYRSLPIVTIDGETARDFDDAVLVTRLPNGNYELQVHIADVAHYVDDGSEIDAEARRRGTSVYFPDRAVPMLPLELSTDLCSLRPEVERLVLSCVMEITPQGEIVSYELGEGIIRSAARMTYTDVNSVIEGDKALRSKYGPLAAGFDLMYELAQILNRKRVKRGSIDFDLPEPVIEFDDFGLMKSISPSERNWAHRLIEEFMLAANETVAGHLEQRVASLYRIHEKPDPKRIYDFETIAASFGYSLGVGALPVKRVQMRQIDARQHRGGDSRGRHSGGRDGRYHSGGRDGGRSGRSSAPYVELPEEVHVTPRMYQKLVQKITGKPEERILSYLILRSLKQARYSEINAGHFALAAPVYTHFTSPIRRYPDLIVHRILKSVLQSGDVRTLVETPAHRLPWSEKPEKPAAGNRVHQVHQVHNVHQTPQFPQVHTGPIREETLHQIADSSSQTERAADEAERELLEWKKLKFMEDRLGETFDGLIVSVTKYGFFVELIDMFIEGLVPLDSLEDDHYAYHDNTRQIIGARARKTYSIGDKVKVLVDRIDHLQRKIQFAVVEEKPQPARKGRKGALRQRK
jgi:ribonuclease R